MYRVMYKDPHQDVADRDYVFYYVRRVVRCVSHDVRQHYAAKSVGEGYELLSLAKWIKMMQG